MTDDLSKAKAKAALGVAADAQSGAQSEGSVQAQQTQQTEDTPPPPPPPGMQNSRAFEYLTTGPWPGISYTKISVPYEQPFKKLLSLIVTRPPIHTELRHTLAEMAVCYFTNTKAKVSDAINNPKTLYQCDNLEWDDRNWESLKRSGAN